MDDVVLRVDAQRITDSFQLRELIRQSTSGTPQQWLVDRMGTMLTLTVTPKTVDERSEHLGKNKIGRVGAIIGTPKAMLDVRYGPIEGLQLAVQKIQSKFSVRCIQNR